MKYSDSIQKEDGRHVCVGLEKGSLVKIEVEWAGGIKDVEFGFLIEDISGEFKILLQNGTTTYCGLSDLIGWNDATEEGITFVNLYNAIIDTELENCGSTNNVLYDFGLKYYEELDRYIGDTNEVFFERQKKAQLAEVN